RIVMIENVPSFATSHGGQDLCSAISELNRLGYWCDVVVVDAKWFVPQSRSRLFVIGSLVRLPEQPVHRSPTLEPAWPLRFLRNHPELMTQRWPLPAPPTNLSSLASVVERLLPTDPRWWDAERTGRFLGSLSPVQTERLEAKRAGSTTT